MSDERHPYRTVTGRDLTDTDLNTLASEAERGYETTDLGRRPGRPRIGSAPAEVVPVRLNVELHTAVKAQAAADSTSLSEFVRDALRAHLSTEPANVGEYRTTSGHALS